MRNYLKRIAAGTVLVGLLCGESMGQGTFIAHHLGSADPVTEGFSLSSSPGASLSPISGGPAGGAWAIHLAALQDIASYSLALTPQQQAQMLSAGWTLSLTLRVDPPYNASPVGIFAGLITGSQEFLINIGANSAGDPVVEVNAPVFPAYTLTGAGPGYHNYQLRFDAAAQNASLWVDGTQRVGGFTGPYPLPQGSLAWGGSQRGHPTINADWSEVSLSIVPEPSAGSLLLCGGVLIFWRCARHRAGVAAQRRELT